jgi:hypothetical protein
VGVIWTHYSDATNEGAKDARIEYGDEKTGLRTVLLPSGITVRARHDLLDKLGVGPEALVFTNAPGDSVTFRDGSLKLFAFPEKVQRAKELVIAFLHNVVAPSGASIADLADIIAKQQVESLTKSELSFFMKAQKIIGADNAASTEGATSPHKRGTRKVAINQEFHTLYAIVHELFHVLEADNVAGLGPGLYEGLTEFMTTSASALDVRRDMTGNGYTYQSNVRTVRKTLVDFPVVTEKDLYKTYFEGDLTAIQQSFETKFYTLFAV